MHLNQYNKETKSDDRRVINQEKENRKDRHEIRVLRFLFALPNLILNHLLFFFPQKGWLFLLHKFGFPFLFK